MGVTTSRTMSRTSPSDSAMTRVTDATKVGSWRTGASANSTTRPEVSTVTLRKKPTSLKRSPAAARTSATGKW